jgi:hypothetical protein
MAFLFSCLTADLTAEIRLNRSPATGKLLAIWTIAGRAEKDGRFWLGFVLRLAWVGKLCASIHADGHTTCKPGKPWPKRCAKKPLYLPPNPQRGLAFYLPPIIPQGGWRGQRNIMYFMVCPRGFASGPVRYSPHKIKLCSIVHLAPASLPPRFGGGKRQLLPCEHTGLRCNGVQR